MANNTKTFADNEPTLELLDKFMVLTRGQGEDFKASLATLLDTINTSLLKPFLISQIGNIKPNINNTYRDQTKYTDNYFEYLMLNGQTINKTDYPELFTVLGVTDSSYILPNFANEDGGCTLRHATNGRVLGSYETDSFKNHSHDISHNHTTQAHNHYMAHQHNYDHPKFYGGSSNNTADKWYQMQTGTTTGGRDYTDSNTVVVNQYNANSTATGSTETTMKNIAVQFYIIAKIFN